LDTDGEGAHTLINCGGGEDAIYVECNDDDEKASLIGRKTKRDRKLKNVHRSRRHRNDAKKENVKDNKKKKKRKEERMN
jgi:hypothetical protein